LQSDLFSTHVSDWLAIGQDDLYKPVGLRITLRNAPASRTQNPPPNPSGAIRPNEPTDNFADNKKHAGAFEQRSANHRVAYSLQETAKRIAQLGVSLHLSA